MLGEIASSESVFPGAASQAPSVMSSRPVQASPPNAEELSKPMENIQVNTLQIVTRPNPDLTHVFHYFATIAPCFNN